MSSLRSPLSVRLQVGFCAAGDKLVAVSACIRLWRIVGLEGTDMREVAADSSFEL